MMFAFIGMFCILGMVLHNEIERDKRRRKRMMEKRIKRDGNGKLNCPNCGDTRFILPANVDEMEGPHGGLCVNVKCAGCKYEYNLTPFGLEDKDGKSVVVPSGKNKFKFFGNEEE